MSAVNALMTALFDLLFAPFVAGPGWLSLLVFSVLAAAAGLVVYRYTSNQPAIRRTKDRIKANMLAIKLFKDDLGVMFRAQGQVLLCAGQMLRYSLVPLAVMIVPFVLAIAQLAMRYQWRPLLLDEVAVLTVQLAPGYEWSDTAPVVKTDGGVISDAPPVRIPSEGRIAWRLRAMESGRHTLDIDLGNHTGPVAKTVTVGPGFQRVSARRTGGAFFDSLLHPAEPPLPTSSPVRSVALAYPARESWFCGSTWWLLWLILVSFVIALLIKPLFRVEF